MLSTEASAVTMTWLGIFSILKGQEIKSNQLIRVHDDGEGRRTGNGNFPMRNSFISYFSIFFSVPLQNDVC